MRTVLILVFALYLALLIKVILFKDAWFFSIVPTNEYYEQRVSAGAYTWSNFVPFHTISLYLSGNVSLSAALFNLGGNVLLFVPFGFLVPLVWRRMNNYLTVFLLTVLVSASFELFQFFTQTGQCDVDDLILNTAGSMGGFLFVAFLSKLRRGSTR